MRIDVLRDDEDRQLFVLNGRLDLDEYDISEEEKKKWVYKLQNGLVKTHHVKDGDETVH